jgi:hypothetical protein
MENHLAAQVVAKARGQTVKVRAPTFDADFLRLNFPGTQTSNLSAGLSLKACKKIKTSFFLTLILNFGYNNFMRFIYTMNFFYFFTFGENTGSVV